MIGGMAGLQGPYYGGSNTFHRRYAIYGFYPNQIQSGNKGLALTIHSLIHCISLFYEKVKWTQLIKIFWCVICVSCER